MRASTRSLAAVAAIVLVPTGLAVQAGPAAATGGGATVTVVATGLANPRHMVAKGGTVYVAEAGRGAVDPSSAPCKDTVNPESGEVETFCYGTTGAVTRFKDGVARRVVTGLPSVAGESGDQATGVSDLVLRHDGHAVGVVNLGGDPRRRAATLPAPAVGVMGRLVAFPLGGKTFTVEKDVAAYEARNNPDAADPGSSVDSNPYAIAGGPDGSVAVADAGGNDLLVLDKNRNISLAAVFRATLVDAPPFLGLPPGTKIPMQAVPNSVVRGPDGAWYVGQLTGFPFPVGAASVWRVVPGQAPTVYASGFTNIIDLAFDSRGRLLVLEIATRSLLDQTSPGALWRVSKGGAKTLVTDALAAPGGVVVTDDRTAYVTNLSISGTQGQLVRVRLPR